jgi:hypothetical protein
MDAYREAEDASTRFNINRRRFGENSSAQDGSSLWSDLADVQSLQGMVEALASGILLALDGALSDLRMRLRKNDRCTDDGQELRYGVTVDRALDAVGNYVRHRHEWLMHDFAATWPNETQIRSVKPIAQLSTRMPIESAQDAYIQFTLADPPAMILDLLCGFDSHGYDCTFESVEAKVLAAGTTRSGRRSQECHRCDAPHRLDPASALVVTVGNCSIAAGR